MTQEQIETLAAREAELEKWISRFEEARDAVREGSSPEAFRAFEDAMRFLPAIVGTVTIVIPPREYSDAEKAAYLEGYRHANNLATCQLSGLWLGCEPRKTTAEQLNAA
jgi:hypothetical protein